MSRPVVRTDDEANLYLDLNPCDCGSVDTGWEAERVRQREKVVETVFRGRCQDCGSHREVAFDRTDDRIQGITGWPTFGGARKSRLFDPGQWLAIADRVGQGGGEPGHQALAVAAKCVDEVMKFIPDGHSAVPAPQFWSQEGKTVYRRNPDRFGLERLQMIAGSYRLLLANGLPGSGVVGREGSDA